MVQIIQGVVGNSTVERTAMVKSIQTVVVWDLEQKNNVRRLIFISRFLNCWIWNLKIPKMEREETVYSDCQFYCNKITGIMQDEESVLW